MNTREAYNQWSAQYDSNINKTRDLEAIALRQTLSTITFSKVLEIGCGTGKNTEWLVRNANQIMAIDLSEEMLSKAKEKIKSNNVQFLQADITEPWNFGHEKYDLVTFSLVLEHLEDLSPIFKKVSAALIPGGRIYTGELHPFKQYSGTKARFETEKGLQIVSCFNHHISDFIQPAMENSLAVIDINEWFDNNDRNTIPRILTILLQKQ